MTRRLQHDAVILPIIGYSAAHVDPSGRFAVLVPDRPDASLVCRWCYGRPMPGFDVCSRTACITHWGAVEAVEVWADHLGGWS